MLPSVTLRTLTSGRFYPRMPPKHAAYHSIVQPCANESLPRRPPRGVIPSLAVLPFQNLSGEPEQQYFPQRYH